MIDEGEVDAPDRSAAERIFSNLLLVGELLLAIGLRLDVARQRIDAQMHLAELAAAAGLLLVAMVAGPVAIDRLAVGDLRLVGDDLQLEAGLEPLLNDVQVQAGSCR